MRGFLESKNIATCPLVHAVPFPQPTHLRWLPGLRGDSIFPPPRCSPVQPPFCLRLGGVPLLCQWLPSPGTWLLSLSHTCPLRVLSLCWLFYGHPCLHSEVLEHRHMLCLLPWAWGLAVSPGQRLAPGWKLGKALAGAGGGNAPGTCSMKGFE